MLVLYICIKKKLSNKNLDVDKRFVEYCQSRKGFNQQLNPIQYWNWSMNILVH